MNKKELIKFLEKNDDDDAAILNMYLKEYEFFKSEPDLKSLIFSVLNYEITVEECINKLNINGFRM